MSNGDENSCPQKETCLGPMVDNALIQAGKHEADPALHNAETQTALNCVFSIDPAAQSRENEAACEFFYRKGSRNDIGIQVSDHKRSDSLKCD
jgi:hypothetical protein